MESSLTNAHSRVHWKVLQGLLKNEKGLIATLIARDPIQKFRLRGFCLCRD